MLVNSRSTAVRHTQAWQENEQYERQAETYRNKKFGSSYAEVSVERTHSNSDKKSSLDQLSCFLFQYSSY